MQWRSKLHGKLMESHGDMMMMMMFEWRQPTEFGKNGNMFIET